MKQKTGTLQFFLQSVRLFYKIFLFNCCFFLICFRNIIMNGSHTCYICFRICDQLDIFIFCDVKVFNFNGFSDLQIPDVNNYFFNKCRWKCFVFNFIKQFLHNTCDNL